MPFHPFHPFRRRRRRPPPPPSPPDNDSSLPHSSEKHPKPVVARQVIPPMSNLSTRLVANDDCIYIPFSSSISHPTDPPPQPNPKSTMSLLCCIPAKFNISFPSRSDARLRSRPSTRTLPGDLGPPSKGPRPPSPPTDFLSRKHREAALRERGLLPPHKDLSEQEREADERLVSVPSPVLFLDGSTEAERLKASWLATNRTTSESDDPPTHSRSNNPPSSSDPNAFRRSGDVTTDHPPTSRPSCSALEVLHEEPSEHGSFTTHPPITVPSKLDYPPSPTLVDSSVISCTFSSHCPGSTLESYSQSGHPSVLEKENVVLPSRASDRSRRVARSSRSSLSKLGTRSLTNLRRSVAGSLKSTVSSADLSASSIATVPRSAIDPTMHSIGSILRAAGDIQDKESRRLSELAFLD